MRKAQNIEHVLCDVKDLLQSVAEGRERIMSEKTYECSIGFGDEEYLEE